MFRHQITIRFIGVMPDPKGSLSSEAALIIIQNGRLFYTPLFETSFMPLVLVIIVGAKI